MLLTAYAAEKLVKVVDHSQGISHCRLSLFPHAHMTEVRAIT